MHRDATDTQVVVTTVSVTGKKFIFTFILIFLFIPLSFCDHYRMPLVSL